MLAGYVGLPYREIRLHSIVVRLSRRLGRICWFARTNDAAVEGVNLAQFESPGR